MRTLVFIAGLLLFAGCTTTKLAHPFLYEVSKGEKTAYLFGTIHTDVKVEELPDSFWPYFDASDVLATEADLRTSPRVFRYYKAMSHKHIKDLVTPIEYETLKVWAFRHFPPDKAQAFIDTGTPSEVLNFAAAVRMADAHPTELHEFAFSMRERTVLDSELLKRAKDQKKKFKYLDDELDSMLLLPCAFPKDEQVAVDIRRVLVGDDVAFEELQVFKKILEIYRRGDATEARTIEKLDLHFRTDQHDCLLKTRNEHWVPEIEKLMTDYAHPFIAVGLAHIENENDSLQTLLRDRGYSVMRVEIESH